MGLPRVLMGCKNNSKQRGITRLATTLASQASMTQRAGRVGRVADGTVYRFVTREQYDLLERFDKPEIQCVSLEMVILKAKQLDMTNPGGPFCNPYVFLMSIIDPPQFR